MVYSLGRFVVTIQGGLPKWEDKKQLHQSSESSITKSGEKRIGTSGMHTELSGINKIKIDMEKQVTNGIKEILEKEKKLVQIGMQKIKNINLKSSEFVCLNIKHLSWKPMVENVLAVEKKKLDFLLSNILLKMEMHIERSEEIFITTWSEIIFPIRTYFQSYA